MLWYHIYTIFWRTTAYVKRSWFFMLTTALAKIKAISINMLPCIIFGWRAVLLLGIITTTATSHDFLYDTALHLGPVFILLKSLSSLFPSPFYLSHKKIMPNFSAMTGIPFSTLCEVAKHSSMPEMVKKVWKTPHPAIIFNCELFTGYS